MLEQVTNKLGHLNQELAQRKTIEQLNLQGIELVANSKAQQALGLYDQALAVDSTIASTYLNKGCALGALGRLDEALQCYVQARTLKPDYVQAHSNESLCRLQMGDFENGWRAHEWRLKLPKHLKDDRNFNKPRWDGTQDLHGKTIFLYAEQGLGDAIQFCRYVELVAQRGARVMLGVHAQMVPALDGLAGLAHCIQPNEAIPPFDYHCPLMSLPLVFGTTLHTIPSRNPYLFANPQRVTHWQASLGPKRAPRIGLVWSGSTLHANDRNRSMALENLAPLLSLPMSFYALQKNIHDTDLAQMQTHSNLLDLRSRLNNLADTAAAIELMDVVIAVDTSVVHLAAALGKPVWLLLPFVADWRWLQTRRDSPWYPTARLFRQSAVGDWGRVIETVKRELMVLFKV